MSLTTDKTSQLTGDIPNRCLKSPFPPPENPGLQSCLLGFSPPSWEYYKKSDYLCIFNG